MECKLLYESATVGEKLFCGTIEKPLDLDFTLPDYCADIQKILKCNIVPIITGRSVSGDKLEMEGTVCVRIFYIDSIGKELRFCEKGVAFSASASLSRAAVSPVVVAEPKTEYINCRAVSSRRLDIHGAFSICAEVIDNGRFEYVRKIDEERIEQKETALVLSELCVGTTHLFSVSSTLETGSSRPVVENIVRSSTDVRIDDVRNMSGTVIIRGNCLISLLYSSGIENMSLEKIEYEIPFNESVETAFSESGGILKACAQVCDVAINVKSDSVGENSIISFDAKIQSEIFIYRDKEITTVSDAYSREYETSIETKNSVFSHITECVHKNEMFSGKIPVSESEISDVIDIWSESASAKYDSGKISGKYNVCVLWRGKDEKIHYTEKNIDFSHPIDLGETAKSSARVISIEGAVSAPGELEVKACVCLDADALSEKTYRLISKIFEDEDGMKIKNDESCVCIYFASKGESVWDIAKKHLCAFSDIKSENALVEDEIKEAQTVIIPV